jgi:hypothetical protein
MWRGYHRFRGIKHRDMADCNNVILSQHRIAKLAREGKDKKTALSRLLGLSMHLIVCWNALPSMHFEYVGLVYVRYIRGTEICRCEGDRPNRG